MRRMNVVDRSPSARVRMGSCDRVALSIARRDPGVFTPRKRERLRGCHIVEGNRRGSANDRQKSIKRKTVVSQDTCVRPRLTI